MAGSWQSRLVSVDNRIAQKLVDNSINLSGLATDVIVIDETLNRVQDVTKIDVNSIGIVNIIFPSMENIPLRRFLNSSGTYMSANDAKSEKEPFEAYAPIGTTMLNQGSILLKFFENPTGTENWILPLRLADIIGAFGGRTIIYEKLILTYYDTPVNAQLYQWLLALAQRRNLLGW